MTRLTKLFTALFLGAPALASADVTLINVFEVPQGREEAAITAWEAARDFLRQEPGYISTELHRSLSPDARFRLINVAKWQSPAAFEAAIGRMQAAEVFPRIEGLVSTPALYSVIRAD
ncbi:MAG: antibiotic biosynthesis monooxygenase [Confluentimicrobium sp.]|uniref:Quinol monooxygenase YgiN n=1 Tax=Actibacterium naphthalenivorans TaxID=1614693 RepID=A0A840CHE6_9RHOB|nr:MULTISPECIES: antibiotic biosynthesis monooxygenase family protein [Actibacterium]KGB80440.1 hypothetical protein JT55_19050 [Rhodovulum sp. NI22]MDY6860220.1 antibiotic biosynthesis monooxygenase family protein [Pseudomonadota bacterium]ALG90555.1 hypothetical protein TQ29_10595 [Actibacterium sp. EMB200-NS6]MBB4023532.1 quinol monooxygenase YgiN [Actibacterium naphthalenivorans]MBC57508.1 antibiotic biosynthesis monooxygenase [Actibacterium sp.]|tara:strand:+ start:2670 stop:3023 length:354 start_codon:yes stop_codon:yes gene_type:complete